VVVRTNRVELCAQRSGKETEQARELKGGERACPFCVPLGLLQVARDSKTTTTSVSTRYK
jgi:hypothetical protein